jgi:hypothetical protein
LYTITFVCSQIIDAELTKEVSSTEIKKKILAKKEMKNERMARNYCTS